MPMLSKQHIATIRDTSEKLAGSKRRAFQAQVTIDYLKSKPRLAERTFGWDRNTVQLGLHELRTGITCISHFKARGNKRTEIKISPWNPIFAVWLTPQVRQTLSFKHSLNIHALQLKHP